jgi:predicted CopG family antitoxin
VEIWKIRQKSTGLFAKGGSMRGWHSDRGWSEKGKNWNKLSHVKLHINNNVEYYRRQGDDIEIVKLTLRVSDKDTLSMVDLIRDMTTKKREKQEALDRYHRERRLEKLEDVCSKSMAVTKILVSL